jgi:hypothetical protein
MVCAPDRHTSRLHRYGCCDGAPEAFFWTLNDKRSFNPLLVLLVGKAGRASLEWSPSIDDSDKRRFSATLHVPPVMSLPHQHDLQMRG